MNPEDTLRLEYKPHGNNGKVVLTMMLGDDFLALNKLDVLSAGARARFATGLCKGRPGINRSEVDQQSLNIAREVQGRSHDTTESETMSGELDVSRIVRPERFTVPEVSGLTVAVPTLRNGRPVGRWVLYLR